MRSIAAVVGIACGTMRRRTLPLSVVSLALVLAACSNDTATREIDELGLVAGSTTIPFEDVCSTPGELPPPDTSPEPTAPPETIPPETVPPESTAPETTAVETTAPDTATTVAADTVETTAPDAGADVETTGPGTSAPTEDADTVATTEPAVGTLVPETTLTPDTTTVPDSTLAPENPPVPDVVLPATNPTLLGRTVLIEGDGPAAAPGATVSVHYVGVFSDDGTRFDTSFADPDVGSPGRAPFDVTIGAGQVIQGWDFGLVGARAGDRIQLDIPGVLAYGANGSPQSTPPIPPNKALTFVIDVLSVEPAEFEWPTELPAETERTWIEHGPEDGHASQIFDTLTVEFTSAILELDEHPLVGILGLDGDDATGVLADDGWLPPPYYQSPAVNKPFGPQMMPLIPGTMGPGLEEALLGLRVGDVVNIAIPGAEMMPEGSTDEPDIGALVVQVTVTDITGPPAIEPADAATEVTVETIETGFGAAAADGDVALVNYVGGATETGVRFVSNWEDPPAVLRLGDGRYVAGLEAGLVGARAGEQRRIDMPADAGYGSAGAPDDGVEPDTALSFVVDVKGVVPADTSGDRPVDPPINLAPEDLSNISTREVVIGEGEVVAGGQTVYVNLQVFCATNGALAYDSFDNARRETLALRSGTTIQGLIDGIAGVEVPGADPAAEPVLSVAPMRVGGTRVIHVPAALAYGSAGHAGFGIGADRDIIVVATVYGAV